MEKYIFNFDNSVNLEPEGAKQKLGNKGATLAEMYKLKMPIPPGFTITTDLCSYYYENNMCLPQSLIDNLKTNINILETQTGTNYHSTPPLLLSVRSGSVVSMPGMMDTILNLGLNDETTEYLAEKTSNPEFAYNCYIRFIEMFSIVALEVKPNLLKNVRDKIASSDNIQSIKFQKTLVKLYKETIEDNGYHFPLEPYDQLILAIESVLKSWNSQRAKIYRKLNNISDQIGTAVTVQSMVFGNLDKKSCTGVIFSRNPANGENDVFGEYLLEAQGEDIVSGKRTPMPVKDSSESMELIMPKQFLELKNYCKFLEHNYKDVQDIEFTVESGKLYILQSRSAKRTATAAIKILSDLVKENLISKEDALLRIDTKQLDQLLHPSIVKNQDTQKITIGLAASPGAATGKIVFCSESAEEHAKICDVILLRNDTCPEDIKGMSLSKGIVTARGGLTSHAAVVARGMGKPCICGVSNLTIDIDKKIAKIADIIIKEFDVITIDGSTGEIFLGEVEVAPASAPEEFKEILEWAQKSKALKVRANAETVNDIKAAVSFGAEGVGLCRTEHMFFDAQKISLVRQMIISQSLKDRMNVIEKILPLHTEDFIKIFQTLNGLPINIRLLDPPLHEFLPKDEAEIEELAKQMNMTNEVIKFHLNRLSEVNPMLGHRGARLGVTHPDIYEMQINAIITAGIKTKQANIPLNIEIMLPLISSDHELIHLIQLVKAESEKVMLKNGVFIDFKLGTMIELPRAALIADKIAKLVDFFSFGTNDLTQTVYGISRDDISSFLPEYKAANILKIDPFTSIDREGVGEIIRIALKKGREANTKLTTGICGEHGGDPNSISFFHSEKLDYISCSPYRIPAAKIAAAQAALREKRN